MTTHFASILAIGLCLTACACNRTNDALPQNSTAANKTVTVPYRKQGYDMTAGRQVQSLKWNRSGEWGPVSVKGPDMRNSVGLISRDRIGTRLLMANPSAGYQVAVINLDCAKRTLTIFGVRSTTSDSTPFGPIEKMTRTIPEMVPAADIQRVCTTAPKVGIGTPSQMVSLLRQANMKAAQGPAAPSAEQRALAWKKYQAEHPGKP